MSAADCARLPADFIVLSTMRSGSNNLQDALNLHPEIECGGEIFNPGFVTIRGRIIEEDAHAGRARNAAVKVAARIAGQAKRWRPQTMLALGRPESRKALFGFRLFGEHIAHYALQPYVEALHARGTRFIHLVRRDTFDQALSLVRARATGVWKTTAQSKGEATQPDLLALANEIKWAAELMHRHKIVAANVARRCGALLLDYDEFTRDEASYGRIQDFLGVRAQAALRHVNSRTPPVDAAVYRELREEMARRRVPMRFDPEAV